MTGLRLRSKFLLLFTLISLVPLVITAVLTYERFQSTLQQDAGALESQLAATAAVRVKSFVVSQANVLDTVATLQNPEFFAKPDEASKIVENVLYKNDNFNDISIVDKSGNEVLRQDRLIVYGPGDLRDISNTTEFQIVKEKGLYVGPMYIRSGKASFDLGRWVVDSQGNFVGAVFAQVDGKVMQQITEAISGIAGNGGRVYIVDQSGIVLAHPDLSYVLGQKDLSALPSVSAIVNGNTNSEITRTYVNEKGNDVLGSVYPITLEADELKLPKAYQINWYVVVEQKRAVIFNQANQVALFSAILFFLAALLAIGAAVFFARKISSPVESLYTATEEFGKGNLLYRTKITTNDEIGDLAKNFDGMAKTLDKSIRNIKQEEKIISAERDKLSIILSGINNAVVAVDLQRKIILFNKAAETLTGLKSSDVSGKPISFAIKLFDGEQAVPVTDYCPVRKTKSKTDSIAYHKNGLRLVPSLGEERTVNVIAGTIVAGVDIDLGCILTFQDTTREMIIEKTKNEFVSIAAHQLRTPLTGVKWSLLDLYNGESGPLEPEQKKLIGAAVNSTRRMITLINDLLDVSRIEEGRFGIVLKKQSLVPILEVMHESFRDPAKKKGVSIRYDIPPRLPPVNIDAEKMEIVLDNLLDNALKYSPAGAEVVLTVTVNKTELQVSVKDSGIGISGKEFDRVFSKFFRSTQALLYHTDGSGLGLYVSKNIVYQHGGKIWFESEENKGSTFYFTLPLPS